MVKIGDRVRILAGSTVGQDFRFFEWSGSSDVVFTVTAILNCDRCALEAPGYGMQGDYGNGRVFVNADRLVAEKPDRLATLESENAKLKDELAAAQEAHALDRAPMLRAMAVFDEGADDERWTPGVHVVDALIADHAKLRDLLRRVRGCFRNGETPATIAIELSTLMPEIKAAVEPAGEPGEVEVA